MLTNKNVQINAGLLCFSLKGHMHSDMLFLNISLLRDIFLRANVISGTLEWSQQTSKAALCPCWTLTGDSPCLTASSSPLALFRNLSFPFAVFTFLTKASSSELASVGKQASAEMNTLRKKKGQRHRCAISYRP